MARISGVDLPRDKRVQVGLTYIFGIGNSRSLEIIGNANIDKDTKIKDLTETEIAKLRELIDTYPVEGDLRREVAMNIKRLREINSYRGMRHRRGLPVRGQQTKTNARTRKGPKKLVSKRK